MKPMSKQIALVAVDTDDYTTQSITNRIVEAITLFHDHEFDRFVVNMSFALIPCDQRLMLTEDEYAAILDALISEDPGNFPPHVANGFDDFADMFQQLRGQAGILELITCSGFPAFCDHAEFMRELFYITVALPRYNAVLDTVYGEELDEVQDSVSWLHSD